jgi:gamma-glutamylcyclotransferase (GGCT)/AIG2-like uncharacterized protein YtfP
MSPFLFVYGTLRRTSDHPMAAYLARHSRFVSLAKTRGRLYDLGAYPGMLPATSDSDWVQGDLFELKNPKVVLAELDRYEGCVPEHPQPYIFQRTLTNVTLPNGEIVTAWVYYHASAIKEEFRILCGEYEPLSRNEG